MKEKRNKPLSLISFSEIREGCLVKTEITKDYRGLVVTMKTPKTNELVEHVLSDSELRNLLARAIKRMVEK